MALDVHTPDVVRSATFSGDVTADDWMMGLPAVTVTSDDVSTPLSWFQSYCDVQQSLQLTPPITDSGCSSHSDHSSVR